MNTHAEHPLLIDFGTESNIPPALDVLPRWRAGIYRVACAVEYRASLIVEWALAVRPARAADGPYDWEWRELAAEIKARGDA